MNKLVKMTSIYEKLKAENEALISELIRIMDTKYGSIVPITRENVIVNVSALISQAEAYEENEAKFNQYRDILANINGLEERVESMRPAVNGGWNQVRVALLGLFRELDGIQTSLAYMIGPSPEDETGQQLACAEWLLKNAGPYRGYSSPEAFVEAVKKLKNYADIAHMSRSEYAKMREEAERLRKENELKMPYFDQMQEKVKDMHEQKAALDALSHTVAKQLEQLKTDVGLFSLDSGFLRALRAIPSKYEEGKEAIKIMTKIINNQPALAETVELAGKICGRRVDIEEAVKIFTEADNVRALDVYQTMQKIETIQAATSDHDPDLEFRRSTVKAICPFRYYSESCPIHQPFMRTAITIPTLTDVPYYLFHKTPLTKNWDDSKADYALKNMRGDIVCILAFAGKQYNCYVPLKFSRGRIGALSRLLTTPNHSVLQKTFIPTMAVTSIVTGHSLTNETSKILRMSEASAREGIHRVNGVLVTADLYRRLERGLDAGSAVTANNDSKTINKSIFASSYEASFASQLDELNIAYTAQYRIGQKRYDFFIPDRRLLVEIDGEGHFADVFDLRANTVRNDTVKAKIAIRENYTLLRIHHESCGDPLPDLNGLQPGGYYMFGGPRDTWTCHINEADAVGIGWEILTS